jgi:hypothetical protein
VGAGQEGDVEGGGKDVKGKECVKVWTTADARQGGKGMTGVEQGNLCNVTALCVLHTACPLPCSWAAAGADCS